MLFRILNIDRSSIPNKFLLGGDSLAISAGGSPFVPFKIRALDDVPPTGTFKATYDVSSVTLVGNNTEIEVVQPIIVPPSINLEYKLIALGFYDVNLTDGTFLFESIPLEADTTNSPLVLPGRGVVNYGEMIIEDLLRVTENFSDVTEPPNKLIGMWWYNQALGVMQFWNGVQWISVPAKTEYETILMTAGQTVIPTAVPTVSRTGNPGFSFLQVFLNGLEQTEGIDYDVTGPNEITWLTPLTLNERVTLYAREV